jgi:hypothetical protein
MGHEGTIRILNKFRDRKGDDELISFFKTHYPEIKVGGTLEANKNGAASVGWVYTSPVGKKFFIKLQPRIKNRKTLNKLIDNFAESGSTPKTFIRKSVGGQFGLPENIELVIQDFSKSIKWSLAVTKKEGERRILDGELSNHILNSEFGGEPWADIALSSYTSQTIQSTSQVLGKFHGDEWDRNKDISKIKPNDNAIILNYKEALNRSEKLKHSPYISFNIAEIVESLEFEWKRIDKFQVGVAHNDPHILNTIPTSKGVKLIDFDDAGQNKISYDLALLTTYNKLSNEQTEALLQGYESGGGNLKPEEYLLLQHVYATKKVSELIIAIEDFNKNKDQTKITTPQELSNIRTKIENVKKLISIIKESKEQIQERKNRASIVEKVKRQSQFSYLTRDISQKAKTTDDLQKQRGLNG